MKRWIVECDGMINRYRTRREARDYAAFLRGHPDVADRRLFGPYHMGGATGRVRVIDGDSACPDCLDIDPDGDCERCGWRW